MMKSFRPLLLMALLSATVFVACSSDDTATPSLEPVVLPAKVVSPTDAASQQAGNDGFWREHDQVAIQIGQTVKLYEATAANGGLLMAVAAEEPFYWTRGTSTVNVKGWYLGGGQTQRTIPATWAVAADQNADDGAGFTASEFIFGPLSAVTNIPGERFRRTINFYHQTSKIVVRVKNTGILHDNPSWLGAVTIGDAAKPIVMEAAFAEPSEGAYGTWTPTGETGYITPHDISASADADRYLRQYEALLIPQDLDFKPLLSFTIQNAVYYYVPQAGEAVFNPGYQYVYDIEVTRQGLLVTPTVFLRPFSSTTDLPAGVAIGD